MKNIYKIYAVLSFLLLVACDQDGTSLKAYHVVFNDPTKLYKVDLSRQEIEVYCGELHYTNPIYLSTSEYHTIDSAFRVNNMASIKGDRFYINAASGPGVIPALANNITISKNDKQISYISIATKASPGDFTDQEAKRAVAFRDVLVRILKNNKAVKTATDSIAHYKGKPLL